MKARKVLGAAVCGCLLYAVSSGIRANYGIMLNAVGAHSGLAYADLSFIIAVGQLVFGIAQPVFGMIALKRSNRLVLVLGALLMAAGLNAVSFCGAFLPMLLALGIVLPVGTGAISFGIIMSALTPRIGEKRAAAASGFVSASSGIGSTVFSPLIQQLLENLTFLQSMAVLSIPALILIPVSLYLTGGKKQSGNMPETASGQDGSGESLLAMLGHALRNPVYLTVTLSFFTCGFHMSIIETHFYSQLLSLGIRDSTAALIFSVYGIATIAGCILSGFVTARIRPNRVLSFLYSSRVVIILLFFFLPGTPITGFVIGILLGMTGGATVTPTSETVGRLFGAEKIGTLFGCCFLAHQLGAFFSAWLGGIFVNMTGGYTLIWCVDLVFALAAGIGCGILRNPKPSAAE